MRCPVCRAENDQGPHCRRCKADLALLFALEDQRRQVLESAKHCLSRGYLNRALMIAQGAAALRHDEDAVQLQAVGHLLRRDFASALQSYLQAQRR